MVVNARSQSKRGSTENPLQIFWQKQAGNIVPPILGIVGFILVWQAISMSGLTRLPAPSSIFTDERTRTLLLYPFYDFGGLDKGLFW